MCFRWYLEFCFYHVGFKLREIPSLLKSSFPCAKFTERCKILNGFWCLNYIIDLYTFRYWTYTQMKGYVRWSLGYETLSLRVSKYFTLTLHRFTSNARIVWKAWTWQEKSETKFLCKYQMLKGQHSGSVQSINSDSIESVS